MSYQKFPISLILPHYHYQKIEENDKVTVPWFFIGTKMTLQVLLGYLYLWAMRPPQVNKIVTATLIYPIVLVNYAGTEVVVSLCRKSNSNATTQPIHIKFILMMLSAQILILSLVVWNDLYILPQTPRHHVFQLSNP